MLCTGAEMGEHARRSGKEASPGGRRQTEAENNKQGPDGRDRYRTRRKVMKRTSASDEKEIQVTLMIVTKGGNRGKAFLSQWFCFCSISCFQGIYASFSVFSMSMAFGAFKGFMD